MLDKRKLRTRILSEFSLFFCLFSIVTALYKRFNRFEEGIPYYDLSTVDGTQIRNWTDTFPSAIQVLYTSADVTKYFRYEWRFRFIAPCTVC